VYQASDREKVRRGAAIALLGRLSSVADGLFMFVAHFLYGGEEFGLFALAFGIVELISRFVVGGFADASTYFVARHHAGEREDLLYEALASCIVWPLGLSVLMAAAATPLVPWVYELAWARQYPDHLVPLLQIAVWALPVMTLMKLTVEGVKAHMDMKWATIVDIARPLITFAAAVGLVLTGEGAMALMAAWIFAHVICTFIGIYGYTRYFSISKTLAAATTSATGGKQRRAILGFAIPQGVNILFNFGLVRIDAIMLSLWYGPEVIAIYTLVSQVVRGIRTARMAFVGVFAPLVAKYKELQNRVGIETSLNELSRFIAHIAIPLLVINLAFYQELSTFAPGTDWEYSRLFPWALAVGPMLACFFGLTGNLLLMSGHSRLLLVNSTIAIIINVVLNLLLIPEWGVLGAALATMISNVVLTVVQLWQASSLESIRMDMRNYAKPIVGLLITVPVLVWMNEAGPSTLIYSWGAVAGMAIKLGLVVGSLAIFAGVVFAWPGENPEKAWAKTKLTQWRNRKQKAK
jgi:O-antigen/teichoic acid export membrane protein